MSVLLGLVGRSRVPWRSRSYGLVRGLQRVPDFSAPWGTQLKSGWGTKKWLAFHDKKKCTVIFTGI